MEDHSKIKNLGVGAKLEHIEDVTQSTRTFVKKTKHSKFIPIKFRGNEAEPCGCGGNSENLVTPESIIEHEKQIDAVMIAIRPSISGLLFQRYTKEMIKCYF